MFTKIGCLRSGLVVAAVLAFGSTAAQAQTNLAWKFKKDDSLKYTTEMTQKNVANVMGMEIETTMTQSQEMHWTVKNVTSGSAEIAQTIDRIKMKMEAPFGGSGPGTCTAANGCGCLP